MSAGTAVTGIFGTAVGYMLGGSPNPPPVANDSTSIHDLVIADMTERKRFGYEKYNTYLQAHNGRNALRDAYEEALDLACYLRQALEEAKGS